MMNMKRGACFTLLIFLVLAGCAATQQAPEREAAPPLTPGTAPEEEVSQSTVTGEGIQASLVSDGMLLQAPGVLDGPVKLIPAFSRVLVTGYEERGADDAYFSVIHGDDRGYLSTKSFPMDSRITAFIQSEREKIYIHNLEVVDRIRRSQEELERHKAWVRPVLTDLFALPLPDAPVLDILERGDIVFVQEEEDGWYRVLHQGPYINYDDISYENLAGIVMAYQDLRDLDGAYREGWIEKDLLSEWEVESLSGDERRRRLYIEENPDLFPIIKEAIMNGEIMIGMTKEMVAASWGPASEIERSSSLFDDREQWVYGDTSLYFEKGILNAWESFDE